MADTISCPFCGYRGDDGYKIQLHIEEHHTEDSPFIVRDDAASRPTHSDTNKVILPDDSLPGHTWTKCTRPGCGEYVLLTDVDDHLEVHEAITAVDEQSDREDAIKHLARRDTSEDTRTRGPYVNRSPQKLQKSQRAAASGSQSNRSLLDYFSGTSYQGRAPPPRRPASIPRHPGRLGKRELGPHAYERTMPDAVRRHLLNDALPRHINRSGRDGRMHRETVIENETSGLINIMSDLCSRDLDTEVVYLCDPSVRHVAKLQCDGNFCGFWNIQMLLSYTQSKKPKGDDRERNQLLPNVLQIQDTIEEAWNNDICSYGRIETGGIRGTRKWIGTHETMAYFTQLGVKVEALSFTQEDSSRPPVLDLLDHIEAHFISSVEGSAAKAGEAYITKLAPIYFQRLGHSMTIVGLERRKDGQRNLLIFDPSFATSESMRMLLEGRTSKVSATTLLKPYRRSDNSLSRWHEFEIVVLQA